MHKRQNSQVSSHVGRQDQKSFTGKSQYGAPAKGISLLKKKPAQPTKSGHLAVVPKQTLMQTNILIQTKVKR